jgi:hypothetical protein
VKAAARLVAPHRKIRPEDPEDLLLRGDMVIRHDSAPNANERSIGRWKGARREQDANDVAGTRARLHDERVGFKGCAQDRTHRAFELSSSLDEEVDSERIATRWKKWTTQVATLFPLDLISRGALGAFFEVLSRN